MSAIDATNKGTPIPLSSVKGFDPSQLNVRKLTPEEIAEKNQRLDQMLVQKNTRAVTPDNDPSNLYAEIRVKGKVVAKVYNGGSAEGPNSLMRLKMEDNGVGPNLAQTRAKQIAEFLGGEVVTAKTAQTQSQWNARPPRQFRVDEAQLALDREQFFGADWRQKLGLVPQVNPTTLLAAQET